VVVDSNDTAIVVSPSSGGGTADPGPTITWIPAQGQPHSVSYPNAITPAALAVDQAGTIWLIGQLYRPVSFGGSTLQPVDNSYYLAHLGADGSPLGIYAMTRNDLTYAVSVIVDASNNVYVVGSVLWAMGTRSYAYVTKFSSSGTQIYDQTFVGSDTNAEIDAIAIAPDGDLVVAGFFNATMLVGNTSLTSAAGLSPNGWFAILDPATGAPRSAFRFGGTTFDDASDVAVTSAGNIRLAGRLSGYSTIGGITVQADPNGSGFIAEVTPTGVARWVDLVGGAIPGMIYEMATNAADVTFAVGGLYDGSATDATVAEVDSVGQLSLPVRVANADPNGAVYCAADHHGGVWVTGEFQGTIDLGTGILTAPNPTLPANFVVHLQP
jgi:hypothetical protein